MKLKAAECPNCGGELQLPEDKNQVTCMYCDTSIVVQEAIAQKKKNISEDADKLLSLINSTIESNDLEQAAKNINQLLELDPDNAHAWILKGKVAFLKVAKEMKIPPTDPRGLDDSVLSIDLHATFNEGFNKAIILGSNDPKIRETIGLELHNGVKICSSAIIDAETKKFFYGIKMYESSANARKRHWLKLLKQSIEIEKKAAEFKESFDLADNVRFIIAMGKGNWVLGTNNDFNLSTDIDSWNNSLQAKYTKEYEERAAKNKSESKGGCFIATAAMGDYNHPVVMDLRIFRDNWLLKRNWGVKFTSWYYTHGPKAASIINKSLFLRRLTFIIVVKPLQIITKKLK